MGSEFDADTQVDATGPQEYAASVSERWDALSGPNGGYLVAIGLQALSAEMPLPDPLVASAYFLRCGKAGPVTVRTETIRAGRRTASGQATLLQDERETVRVLATFGDLGRSEGRTLMFNEPPSLPPPEECAEPMGEGSMPGVSIIERFDYRFPKTPGWLRGEPAHEPVMEFWLRLKDGREADPVALALMVDAAPPVVLDMGEKGSMTLEQVALLHVGQILQLPKDAIDQVRLRSGQQGLYKCRLGKAGSAFTVRITDPVNEEEDLLDELAAG